MFSRFGTRLDEKTRSVLAHGQRIRACLKQLQYHPLAVAEQLIVLTALTAGLFDNVALDEVAGAERAVIAASTNLPRPILEQLRAGKLLGHEDREIMLRLMEQCLAGLEENHGANFGELAT